MERGKAVKSLRRDRHASSSGDLSQSQSRAPSTAHSPLLGSPSGSVHGGHGYSSSSSLLVEDAAVLYSVVASSYWSLLLLVWPLAIWAYVSKWGEVAVFVLNFLVIIPLALILGEITETLAEHFGDVVGGLLNATFGNVVEIILGFAALRKRLFTVVSMTLVGSMLSNLLLVTGSCFVLGGITFRTQAFSTTTVKAYSSMLVITLIGLMIPSVYSYHLYWNRDGSDDEVDILNSETLAISRASAIVLLGSYLCYLAFSLYTHHDLFAIEGEEEGESEEEEEERQMSIPGSIVCLTIITILIAISSELLTGSIEAVSAQSGLNMQFIGIVLLPFIGNACEHISAILVAMKNKMDLAMAVAFGSSIQIAMLATPMMVLGGWAMNIPYELNLDPMTTLILFLSILLGNTVVADGKSQWLIGVLMIFAYLLIGATYYLGEFE